MAWQKRSIQLIIGLPLALPIVTYAVNIGETYVQSGQNQPLNASINVTDIDPKSFSVNVANPEMYKQLGLSADQQVEAKFQPTSNNGGKIILTTKSAVAAPFTDVVLNIENKGEKNLLPKTLLLPIDERNITTQQPTQTIDVPQDTVVVTQNEPIDLPKTSVPDITPAAEAVETAANTATANLSAKSDVRLPITGGTLSIQETRRYLPLGVPMPNIGNLPTEATGDNTTATATPPVEKPTKTPTKKPSTNNPSTSTPDTENTSPTPTTTYIVQRNDNLWTISSRIAAKNKTSPQKVMQDIMDANPDAFENGDAARIMANTALAIPKYKIVPSNSGIKAAKQTRQQAKTTGQKSTSSKNNGQKVLSAKQKPTTQRAIRRGKYNAAQTRSTYKTEMTIVAPSQARGNSQGSSQVQNEAVAKRTAPQLLEQVKQKRQNTAAQASRVNQLNSSLQSSEQKIRLQNDKLAMLEQRLKALNK